MANKVCILYGLSTCTLPGYYYYYYHPYDNDTYTLGFPNYQYICNLSFAYILDGATTLSVLQLNYDQVDVAAGSAAVGSWQRADLHFTLPVVNRIYPLYFYESLTDIGEATLANAEIFLALDDINITFCLPCNFDNLTAEGNMVLNVPYIIPVQIGEITNTSMSATSSICPSATFIYTIESGKPGCPDCVCLKPPCRIIKCYIRHLPSVVPAQLVSIFRLDPYSGVLTVDGSDPYLVANEKAGNITVCQSNHYISCPVQSACTFTSCHIPPVLHFADD